MRLLLGLVLFSFASCDTLFFNPFDRKENPNRLCPDKQGTCPSKSTCCKLESGKYGCCPLPDAECCSDHVHCCPRGFTCDVTHQACRQGSLSVDWTQKLRPYEPVPTGVICPGGKVECPTGSTCCVSKTGGFGCCPLKEAVCCADKEHCCPRGYTCDMKHGRCNKKAGPGSVAWLEAEPAVSRDQVDKRTKGTSAKPNAHNAKAKQRGKPSQKSAQQSGKAQTTSGGKILQEKGNPDKLSSAQRGKLAPEVTTSAGRKQTRANPKQTTSNPKPTTSEQKQSTLQQKQSTSQQKQSTLLQKQSTLQQKQSTLPQKQSTLQQKQSTLQQKQSTSKTKQAVTKPRGSSPKQSSTSTGKKPVVAAKPQVPSGGQNTKIHAKATLNGSKTTSASGGNAKQQQNKVTLLGAKKPKSSESPPKPAEGVGSLAKGKTSIRNGQIKLQAKVKVKVPKNISPAAPKGTSGSRKLPVDKPKTVPHSQAVPKPKPVPKPKAVPQLKTVLHEQEKRFQAGAVEKKSPKDTPPKMAKSAKTMGKPQAAPVRKTRNTKVQTVAGAKSIGDAKPSERLLKTLPKRPLVAPKPCGRKIPKGKEGVSNKVGITSKVKPGLGAGVNVATAKAKVVTSRSVAKGKKVQSIGGSSGLKRDSVKPASKPIPKIAKPVLKQSQSLPATKQKVVVNGKAGIQSRMHGTAPGGVRTAPKVTPVRKNEAVPKVVKMVPKTGPRNVPNVVKRAAEPAIRTKRSVKDTLHRGQSGSEEVKVKAEQESPPGGDGVLTKIFNKIAETTQQIKKTLSGSERETGSDDRSADEGTSQAMPTFQGAKTQPVKKPAKPVLQQVKVQPGMKTASKVAQPVRLPEQLKTSQSERTAPRATVSKASGTAQAKISQSHLGVNKLVPKPQLKAVPKKAKVVTPKEAQPKVKSKSSKDRK